MARPLDVRCGARVEAVETAGGRVRGVRLAGGERLPADVVVSNADVMRTDAPARPPLRRAGRCGRRCRASCSTSASIARSTPCGTTRCSSVAATANSSGPSRAGGTLPRTFSTYVHAPARTEAGMAPPGGDSLAVLLPVPNLRADVDWEREGRRAARRARRRPRAHVRAGRPGERGSRGAPDDAAGLRARPRGRRRQRVRASSRRCASRPASAHRTASRGVAGMYHVGGGTHPGAGDPRRAARRRGDGRPGDGDAQASSVRAAA